MFDESTQPESDEVFDDFVSENLVNQNQPARPHLFMLDGLRPDLPYRKLFFMPNLAFPWHRLLGYWMGKYVFGKNRA